MITARIVKDLDDQDSVTRGDIEIKAGGMLICCPGCGHLSWLPFGVTDHRPEVLVRVHKWQLSGTPEKPTLTPSIHHIGCWHGWLRDGIFTPC